MPRAHPTSDDTTGPDVPYIDTHCHLDRHRERTVTDQVTRARDAGVTTMITVGTDLASSTQAVRTAKRFDGVHAVVGIHPNDAIEATPQVLRMIELLGAEPEVVGIGETGMDQYRDHTTPEQQEASFRAHIELAKTLDRTLVIHCRDAWDPCLAILEDQGPPPRVVMHCFSGDVAVVRRCAEAGWYQSYAGNVTFKNADALRLAAVATPLQLLLTETDSPFLTPHPHRGEPNDPSYVPLTLRALAQTRGEPVEVIEQAVAANTRRAFALPDVPSADPA